ncbi:hypothetical protein BX070DRAFT_224291 [Coemansia spiralis]|nr:hypothetical protein BX070DRAFT_224291 [Coemansia spiralis]
MPCCSAKVHYAIWAMAKLDQLESASLWYQVAQKDEPDKAQWLEYKFWLLVVASVTYPKFLARVR